MLLKHSKPLLNDEVFFYTIGSWYTIYSNMGRVHYLQCLVWWPGCVSIQILAECQIRSSACKGTSVEHLPW